MTLFDALILGIVEGITEFLPISSTGHLILTGELLGLPSTEFLKSFEIAIQLGAMCAVVWLYARAFLNIEIMKRVAAAFIPTAVIGFAAYPFVKSMLLGNSLVVVIALALGGIALIVFEWLHTERESDIREIQDMSYAQAALVGVAQAVAVIPGVSRSAATIVGGLLAGVSRVSIVEFSFLLAVPTIAAATGLDLLKSYDTFAAADIAPLALGFFVSFVVALLSIKFLLHYVRSHTFVAFGIYRIAVAIAFFIFVL